MDEDILANRTYSVILWHYLVYQSGPVFHAIPIVQQKCVKECCLWAATHFDKDEFPQSIKNSLNFAAEQPDLTLFKKIVDQGLLKLPWFYAYLKQQAVYGFPHFSPGARAVALQKFNLGRVRDYLQPDFDAQSTP